MAEDFLTRRFITMVLIGTILQAEVVDAITCYQCFSWTDNGCDRFDASSMSTCSGADSCWTFKGSVDGTSAVMRDCHYGTTYSGCQSVSEVYEGVYISGSYCFCTSSYCNTAHSTLRNPGFMTLIWAVAVGAVASTRAFI
jgi:hypothetical protein